MPSFDLSLLLHGQYRDWMLNGLGLSLWLASISLLFALPLAVVVALLRLAPLAAARAIGSAYVECIRNVPLLAHLLFWYFGAPELLPAPARQWLYNGTFGNVEVIAAVIALSLYASAYMAEDIRSGIRAVPRGQFEAARALGFGFLGTMRRVVLPQAIRHTVPPLVSQTLNLWKDTSIATVIGVGELTYQAARIESASFRSAEAFAFTTSAYLAVSLAITSIAAWSHQRWPVHST